MGVEVVDPFNVAADAAMPFLKRALDPTQAAAELGKCLSESKQLDAALSAIRVRRHKPGRRCLIEYEFRTKSGGRMVFFGKARMKGTDRNTFEAVRSLWNSGFGPESSDGISVPEPIGVVPAFNMWLQAKVQGELATQLLATPDATALARRIAEAAHKLHSTPAVTSRKHTLADELAILRDRFEKVKVFRPEWTQRLDNLLSAGERLGASIAPHHPAGIHRDFYSDHVIVGSGRLWLVDFDLYSIGDPALDIGNFIAHVTELSLRTSGDSATLRNFERTLENRFVELSGEENRRSAAVYTTLSLARHIYISTLFPARQPFTERLLELCEERVA